MNPETKPSKNPFLKEKFIKNLLKNFSKTDSASAIPKACTCTTDLKGIITEVSPEFLTLSESEISQVTGKPIENFLKPVIKSENSINFEDIIQDQNLLTADHEIYIKS